jgi:hypothetical protein
MQVTPMRAIELLGEIDDQHRLSAEVPEELPAGSVRLIVLMPDEDEAGLASARGVSAEWSADLSDPNQDIYTLDDSAPSLEGKPAGLASEGRLLPVAKPGRFKQLKPVRVKGQPVSKAIIEDRR